MPQANPMNWIYLMMINNMLLLMVLIFIFFIFLVFMPKKNYLENSKKNYFLFKW